MMPTALSVSGQRSKTQNTIGAFITLLRNIAGIPTDIGEGSYTKIKSGLNLPILKKPIIDALITNEI